MKKVLTLFTCLLLIGVCEGTTYYMRADGTAASKSAATSCSSAATAMSCSTHNSQTFSGDDVIKLCDDGGTYSCTLIPPSSGASGHPITYEAQTGDFPVFDGAGRQFGISISQAYIVLDGVTVQNSQSEGILVTNHDVTVQNCIVRDCGATNNKVGLSFWGSSGGEVYNGTIRNCIAYNNYASGIFMGADHDYAPYNGLVENCISYGNGRNIDADHGIYAKYGVTVRNCTVYDNDYGGGIKANDDSSPYPGRVPIIEYNLSYGNRYGIVSTSTGATYQYNILRENDRYNIMDLASANSYFYNNTLYNSGWHGLCFYYPASGNTFKNNIIYESVSGAYYPLYVNNNGQSPGNTIDAIAANNTFDHNHYYTDESYLVRDWKDINSPPGVKYTFTQWKGLTGSPDAHSQLTDPLFINNPPQFIDFSPPHMGTGVTLTPTLSWSATDPDPGDTLTYNIYFGKTSPPPLVLSNQTTTTYQPAGLSSETRYYWKIVARDNHGLTTPMQKVYFDTVSLPPQFTTFTPSDGTIDVSVKPALKWTASDPNLGDVITYDVYLGTSSGPPLVAANLTKKVYRPSELLPFTLYYWRVVARDNHGMETSSTEMTFTTGPPAAYVADVSPNPCKTKQVITITGKRFGDTQGESVIRLDTSVFRLGSPRILLWSDTRIDFKIPAYTTMLSGTAQVKDLWVRVNGTPSNKIKLTIIKR